MVFVGVYVRLPATPRAVSQVAGYMQVGGILNRVRVRVRLDQIWGRGAHPLFSDQTEALRAEKNLF